MMKRRTPTPHTSFENLLQQHRSLDDAVSTDEHSPRVSRLRFRETTYAYTWRVMTSGAMYSGVPTIFDAVRLEDSGQADRRTPQL